MKTDPRIAHDRALELFHNAGIYARPTWGGGRALRGTNHAQLADLPPTPDEISRSDFSGGLAIINGTPHPAGGFVLNIDVDEGPEEWKVGERPHQDWLLIEEGTGPGKWHISVRTKDQLAGQIDFRPADNPRGKALAELKGKGITALRSYPTIPPNKPKGYTPRYIATQVTGDPAMTVDDFVHVLQAFYLRSLGKPVIVVRQGADENGRGRGPLPDDMSEAVESALDAQGAKLRAPRASGWQQGYCPFHDDREASLSVNFLRNSWKCFAGCGSGSLWSLADRLGVAVSTPGNTRNQSKSRIGAYIRDFDGLSAGASTDEPDEKPAADEPTLASIATERAGNPEFKDFSRCYVPVTPDMETHGSSSLFRHKDNGRHLVTHAGLSDTWQIEGNAQFKRQRYLAFYTAGFQWWLKEKEGALYLLRWHLHPDSIEEARAELRRLRQRIGNKKGNYLEVTTMYEDEGGGCYVHLYTDTFDNKLSEHLIVPTAADLIDTFQHATKIPEHYGRKHPVRASEDWRMRRARTGEWEAVGTRMIYDLASYDDAVDKNDIEKAEKWGIRTWKASEQEMMGRAPESIMFTRHFEGPENISDEEMLIWAQGLGFRLFPHAQDEVDAILDPAAIERRKTNRAMRKQEGR